MTRQAGTVRVGGQALVDGVLMRTARAWAIARSDGSVETGTVPRNPAAAVPVIRIFGGLAAAFRLAVARGMLQRSRRGAGAALSRRRNARFLWALLAVELVAVALSAVAGRWDVHGPWRLVTVLLPWSATLAVLRIATPASLWRFHGAEHKAVAAYEAGVRPDDVATVLAASRVHDRCGTNLLVIVLILSAVLVRLPLGLQIPAFVAAVALAAEAVALAAAHPRSLASWVVLAGGRALQRWVTTSEPHLAEQAVACRALSACLAEHARLEAGAAPQPSALLLGPAAA